MTDDLQRRPHQAEQDSDETHGSSSLALIFYAFVAVFCYVLFVAPGTP